MFRTVDAKFWTDPKIRNFDSDTKLAALYLVTNPHTHLGGIYYLPMPIMSLETGISQRRLDTLWDTLSGADFARNDGKNSVVWVIRMFKYQGQGKKHAISVSNQLKTLHNSFLIKEFLQTYPVISPYFSDRVSMGYPEIGAQDKEQDKEQDKSIHSVKNRFVQPTIEEVRAYCLERAKGVNAEAWMDHYTANGWKVGKNPMKDWRAAVRQWERNDFGGKSKTDKPICRPMTDEEIQAENELFKRQQ